MNKSGFLTKKAALYWDTVKLLKIIKHTFMNTIATWSKTIRSRFSMQYQEFSRLHGQWWRWLGWPTSINDGQAIKRWLRTLSGIANTINNVLNTIVYIYMNMSPFFLFRTDNLHIYRYFYCIFLIHFIPIFSLICSFSSTHQVLKLELSTSSWKPNYKLQAFSAMALGIVSFILIVHFDYIR